MFNILDFIFLILSLVLLISGVLINYYEKFAPKFILIIWKYGSFSYKGRNVFNWIKVLPKSYFRHFYLYASIICVCSFYYMVRVYYTGDYVYEIIYDTLKFLVGDDIVHVSVSTALLTMFLFTIQVLRRLYETTYLQVFAKTSQINILYYNIAFVHYTACILMLLGHAPLFTGCQNWDSIKWFDLHPWLTITFVVLFALASYEQHRSNIILANLRKDYKGEVVTEEYSIPQGRWFNWVSSPHRLAEVVIYGCLFILHGSVTSLLAFIWVFINQTMIAISVHKWYLTKFSKYPTNRKAIIPFFL